MLQVAGYRKRRVSKSSFLVPPEAVEEIRVDGTIVVRLGTRRFRGEIESGGVRGRVSGVASGVPVPTKKPRYVEGLRRLHQICR